MRSMEDQISTYDKAEISWTPWTYKDINVMGWVQLAPDSEYLRLVGPVLEAKRLLAVDFWLKNLSPTPIKREINQLADQILELTGDPAVDPIDNRNFLAQETLSRIVGSNECYKLLKHICINLLVFYDLEDLAMITHTPHIVTHQKEPPTKLYVSSKDRLILRNLASQVAEISARPVEEEKRKLWYRHNALAPTRPLIFFDPENGWKEIITADQLGCEGKLARAWEFALRKEIYWGMEIRDDRVIEPFFNLAHVYTESDWGMHEVRIGGEHGNAYTWESPLKDYSQMAALHFPVISVDWNATQKLIALGEETVGDFLTVRLKNAWVTIGMTWTLVNLRGLSQIMYDMLDHPDEIHQIMAFLRDGYLAKLDFLQQNGLFSLNNDGSYIEAGGFGWTHELPQKDFTGQVRTQDMWGFGDSQETVGISPKMFGEFIFPYQLPILSRYGLNSYGCCEPIDSRWQYVEKIPNLRRVSVSPWSSIPRMAEYLGNRYLYGMKPNPADLAMPSFDEDHIRTSLRQDMHIARDCRLEVVMKDTNTFCNDPRRVARWVQIAREEAEAV